MKMLLCSILIFSTYATTVLAGEKKVRLPASLDCDSSQMTQDLSELLELMYAQKTLKPSRYDKMMTAINSAKDCDEVNKIALIAVGDCVLTDRKKTACK